MRMSMLRSLSGKCAALAAGVIVASFAVLGATSTPALSTPAFDPPDGLADNHYLGASECRGCHKKNADGNQYGKWASIKHADAFTTLGTEAAKEVAKKAGVEAPQTDAKCLKCHTTGAGEPAEKFSDTFDREMGVQCESCHGAGENHEKNRFAEAANAKPGERMTVGTDEINSHPSPQGCITCHSKESPTYKGFCFAKFQPVIRHLDPRKKRTPEEQAVIDMSCGCGDTCTCDGVTTGGCKPAK